MRLEEGKRYSFNVLKDVELPGGKENLLLLGPDKKRYLLPLEYYTDYHLPAKGEIICKVDKINCTGLVFLEPQHPVYKEGESYEFIVLERSYSKGDQAGDADKIMVADNYGNVLAAPLSLFAVKPETDQKINLRIERISKGKIFFFPERSTSDTEYLAEGKSYEFRIDRIVVRDEEYYVARDFVGGEHLLKVKYYSNYGFRPGTIFTGRIIRFSPGAPKTIEPENPWYKVGDIIEVTISSFVPLETENGFMAEVSDDLGVMYSLRLDDHPLEKKIRCRVIKIRKGRPVLAFIR